MRKPLLFAISVAVMVAACSSNSPTGPSTVTVETPVTTTTTSVTTTTVPPTTTIPTTTAPTTSVIPIATTRTYVSLGQVPANVPSSMTLVHTPASGRITGFFFTPSGVGGHVSGSLSGNLDSGSFSGTMTSETPECIAEREFGGTLDPQFLRWGGGTTLRDCKGNPLAFNSLVMLASAGPPPTSTIAPTTTILPPNCSFALSTDSVSVDGAGGQRTVGLSAGPSCQWSAQNFAPWITVQPPSGIGSATISLTIDKNPGAPRSATVVIAGLPLIVNQGLPTTTTTTTVPTSPDLLPVTPTGNFCRKDSSSLVVDIRNQGNGPADTSFTRVFFDNRVASASFVDRVTSPLGPTTTTTLTFAIPASCQVATCSVLITADASFLIQESNEGNNSVTTTCDLRP